MSIISDRDYCNFYRLWKYEYAKRNPKFLRAISTVFSTPDGDVKRKCRHELERYGFGTSGWIGYYVRNASKRNNILGLLESGDVLPYPNDPLFAVETISVIEYSGNTHDYVSDDHGHIPPYTGICRVNFALPLDNLIDQLRREYNAYHGDEEPTIFLNLASHMRTSEEALRFERMAICNRPNVSFEVDHMPRAVGLWLYDFVTENGGGSPKRGKFKAAYDEAKSRFSVVRKRYGASDSETLRKLLARTKACISNIEVMTLK